LLDERVDNWTTELFMADEESPDKNEVSNELREKTAQQALDYFGIEIQGTEKDSKSVLDATGLQII
jgi:hypothetical protein